MQLARSHPQAAARRPQQCRHAPSRPNYATALRSSAAGEPATTWVDSSLADWLVSHGGAVHGVELVYERQGDGSVSRTLIATRVRARSVRACATCMRCSSVTRTAARRRPTTPLPTQQQHTAGSRARRRARPRAAGVPGAVRRVRRRRRGVVAAASVVDRLVAAPRHRDDDIAALFCAQQAAASVVLLRRRRSGCRRICAAASSPREQAVCRRHPTYRVECNRNSPVLYANKRAWGLEPRLFCRDESVNAPFREKSGVTEGSQAR